MVSVPVVRRQSALGGRVFSIEPVLYGSVEDRRVLHRAVSRLAAACMASRGYEFIAESDQSESAEFNLDQVYGSLSDADIELGYPSVEDYYATRIAATDEARLRREAKGQRYVEQLYGTEAFHPDRSPDGQGCLPAAEQAVFGKAGGFPALDGFQFLLDLLSASGAELFVGPVGSDLVRKWAECMAQDGFSFSTIDQPRMPYASARQNRASPDNLERKTVAADLRCRRSTNLEAGLYAEQERILSSKLEENQLSVQTFTEQVQIAVNRAIKILE